MDSTTIHRNPRKKTLEIRRRIRDAAKQLFAQRGFDATSVQAIGDVVGMGKQAVRYHYPSKEKLRQEVYAEMAHRWSDFLPRLLHALASTSSAQDELLDELGALVDDEPYLAQLVLRDMLEGGGAETPSPAGLALPQLAASFDRFQDLKTAGIVRRDADVAAAFVVVLQVIIPVLALAAHRTAFEDNGNDDWRRTRLREAFRVLRCGIVTPRVA